MTHRQGGHAHAARRNGPRAVISLPEPPAAPRRTAFPGAELSAPSFDDEIDVAITYEKGLFGKALLSISIVLLLLAMRAYFSWLAVHRPAMARRPSRRGASTGPARAR